MHQSDNCLSLCIRIFHLLFNPWKKRCVDSSCSNMFVGIHSGIGIRTISAGIDSDDYIIPDCYGIRQTACLFSCRRCVILCIIFSVISKLTIDLFEFCRSRGRCLFFLTIFKCAGILIIIDVMISIDNKYFCIRLIFDRLQFLRHVLVSQFFSVFGKISGYKNQIRLICLNHIKCRIQNSSGFCQHLRISAYVCLIVFTITDIIKRIVMCVGYNTYLQIFC